MFPARHLSIRRNRSLTPSLEPIEGRILLSAGAGVHLPARAQLFAEAARRRRLPINGKLSGQLTPQTSDRFNYLIKIDAQGKTGNRRVGAIALHSSFATTLPVLTSLAITSVSVPGLSMTLSNSKGTIDAVGTLTVDPSSRRTPFKVTATIRGGTGLFAGATGNLTIQGTSFLLATGQLQGKLRGTIVAHS